MDDDAGAQAAVLLAPVVPDVEQLTPIGRAAARMRLVDAGDHVVWHVGDASSEWTLPDQPRRDGVPVLAAIERADTWRRGQRGIVVPESYLLLVADDGTPLARLARVSTYEPRLYTERDLSRIWPDAAFEPLLERGVERRTRSYADISDLNDAHPGAVPPGVRASVGGRAVAIAWLIALALLVVVLIARRHT